MKTWEFLKRPSKGGHRFFRGIGIQDVNGENIAIADNSGETPDRTEDGTMWIDRSRKISISQRESGSIAVDLPLHKHGSVRDAYIWTGITVADLDWLLDAEHWSVCDVEVSTELQQLTRVISRIPLNHHAHPKSGPEPVFSDASVADRLLRKSQIAIAERAGVEPRDVKITYSWGGEGDEQHWTVTIATRRKRARIYKIDSVSYSGASIEDAGREAIAYRDYQRAKGDIE